MTPSLSKLDRKITVDVIQKKPAVFFTEILGADSLESYQKDKILKAIVENDRVVIRACHDVGKSWTLARVALWFASAFPDSKVITTAPTFNQVKNILWAEMRSAHATSKFPLGGKMNLTDWNLGPEWFALGFTPKNEVSGGGDGQGTQSTFQGFHAKGGVLILFDEATGIPHNIWTMAEGLMTSAHVKFVAIGNPTSTASEFYRKFKDPSWFKVSLNCFDSPNLPANGFKTKKDLEKEVNKIKLMNEIQRQQYLKKYKVVKPYLLTAKWVIEKLLEWGFDHPLAQSKIFGEFPETSDDALVSLGTVEAAQLRDYEIQKSDRKSIGIDPARYGIDNTVFTALEGKKQVGYKKVNGKNSHEVSGLALNMAIELWGPKGADIFVVDETGLGSGVVDNLEAVAGDGKTPGAMRAVVRGVQFGEGVVKKKPESQLTTDEKSLKAKYVNIKARMFDLLAEDLKADDGLSIMNESDYAAELPLIKKKYNTTGQMQIQSKDEFKKLYGNKSPDSSDSLALANFGRYDEIDIGSFGDEFDNDDEDSMPLAVRLGGVKNW